MSGKIISAAVAAILIGSTAMASAQTTAQPRYWGDSRNWEVGPPVVFGFGPGYYAPRYYTPGYYDYAPAYDCGVYGCNWDNAW
jgi:hypothetical protein